MNTPPSPPSRERFVDEVVSTIRTKFPLVKIARGEHPFTLRINGGSVSLENLYRTVLLKPEELKHHIERWMVELLRAAEGLPDQGGTFEQLKDRILPMVLSEPGDDIPPGQMVTQPLIDGLVVAYAVDNDRTIAYIPRVQFDNWHISVDDLHETALENLVKRSESLNAHAAQDENGEVNLILFQTLDGYDASRLLLPSLHDRLREHLGSPFAAAVPNRDILLCFRNDDETVSRLRQQIADDYRQMPHQVTDRILLITADGIAARD
ncbi:MAG TPA: DUF1444 family protein [Tepidisphaeraceae bacterium]|jgi:hypothetical protein|nr:DUF1444 family protein [Tepidisphaeraceae bacterium]